MARKKRIVGVRELRRELSSYLRRVERGERFTVTTRNRAIAELGPAAELDEPVTHLVVERGATPASGDLLDLPALELPGGPPLTELVSEDRAERLQLAGELAYLDASAITKLVIDEPETKALRDLLRDWPDRVSSVLSIAELRRASSRRRPPPPPARVGEVLTRLTLIPIEADLLDSAGRLEPPDLRTLDAIHLATALSLGDDLGMLVAYDRRLIEAARDAGAPVEMPTQRRFAA